MRYGVVVGEDVSVLETEEREEALVQFLLVHAAEREDRPLSPLSEAGLGGGEVRVVGLEHRHRHAEDCGDLLDDLLASGEILRREVQRRELDVAGHRDEVPVLPAPTQPLLDLLLESVELVAGRVSLDDDRVVWASRVRERREVHLVDCVILEDGTVRGLDLPDPVEEVPRVGSLEVDHLVGVEHLLPVRVHAVEVAPHELIFVRDDLDELRSQRPKFAGDAGRLVDHGMEVAVPGELAVEDAEDGEVESVEVRVRLREYVEDGVLAGHLLEVGPEVGDLAEHAGRRSPLPTIVSEEVSLPRPRDGTSTAREVRRVGSGVEAYRESCDRVRVDICRRVDPRAVAINAPALIEWSSDRSVLARADDVHA